MSIRSFLDKKWLIIILRVIVGGFYVLSGFLKLLLPPEEVQALIRAYEILPSDLTYPAALLLPWIELILGLVVVIGLFPLYTIILITGTTALFSLLLLSVILRGIPLEDCGCLGGIIQETPLEALVRDIFLILLCLPILRFYLFRKKCP